MPQFLAGSARVFTKTLSFYFVYLAEVFNGPEFYFHAPGNFCFWNGWHHSQFPEPLPDGILVIRREPLYPPPSLAPRSNHLLEKRVFVVQLFDCPAFGMT